MRTVLKCGLLAATILVAVAAPALAWHLEGRVTCQGSGQPIAGVTVTASGGGCGYSNSATTGADGHYSIELSQNPCCYRAEVSLGAGAFVTSPALGYADFCTSSTAFDFVQDFVISSPSCGQTPGLCWLTGGGAKFSSITGTNLGEYGIRFNWGGNVNPGCSPTAGDGGSWNHIDRDLKLHFHGQAITVVRCGNIDDFPPGSTSPATPFNFIEFTGTGTLKGIQGNKADYGIVNFFARCEDRNEPGSTGQQDGNLKDRYFLHVWDGSGKTLMLLDVDGDPSTVDPVTITKGNMQIHISSCDNPPPLASSAPSGSGVLATAKTSIDGLKFAAGPNPTRGISFMTFALPRDANVSLAAFDVSGRLVRQLASGRMLGGEHSVTWNLRDMRGQRVGTGVYFIRMTVDGRTYGRVVTVMP